MKLAATTTQDDDQKEEESMRSSSTTGCGIVATESAKNESRRLHNILMRVARESGLDRKSKRWNELHDLLGELASAEELKSAIETPVGDSRMSFLHVMCMHDPPMNVVKVVTSACPESTGIIDDRGRLPLHVACQFGASAEVVENLVQTNRIGMTHCDKRDRVPLHYALESHVVASANMKSVHPSLVGAGSLQFTSPEVVSYVATSKTIIMRDQEGNSPLDLLSKSLNKLSSKRSRQSNRVERRVIDVIMACEPEFTCQVTSSLRSFPQWALEHALSNNKIRRQLNVKSADPFTSCFFLLDILIQCLLIAAFSLDFTQLKLHGTTNHSLIEMYVGSFYFGVRIITNLAGFAHVGRMDLWMRSLWHWLDLVHIFVLLSSTLLLQIAAQHIQLYRSLIVATVGLQWIHLLSLLRTVSISFSVFMTGVGLILVNLLPFLLATFLLLGSFAFMYYVASFDSASCTSNGTSAEDRIELDVTPCTISGAAMSVYTMFAGSVEDEDFSATPTSFVISVAFSFVVIILQLNVLIAVITDTYSGVKNRGQVVFWKERLYCVANLELVRSFLGLEQFVSRSHYDRWSQMWRVRWDTWYLRVLGRQHNLKQDSNGKRNFCRINFIVRPCLLFLMSLWLLVGMVTVGWLWPPQAREALFYKSDDEETSHKGSESEALYMLQKHISGAKIERDLVQSLATSCKNVQDEVKALGKSDAIHRTNMNEKIEQLNQRVGRLDEKVDRIYDTLQVLLVTASPLERS